MSAVLPTDPSRRQVICGLAAALAVPGVLAACSSGSTGSGTGTTPLSQIPVGGGVIVNANGPVLVTQPTAGTVKAFDAACPHQGTTVNPPAAGTVTCPRHGSQFDAATGALRRGPATRGLTEVPSRVQNGSVVLG